MKRITYIIVYLLCINKVSLAQHTKFTNEGVITYERTTNVYSILQRDINRDRENTFSTQAFEQLQKNHPQFRISSSKMSFAGNKTLFTPIEGQEPSLSFFSSHPALNQINTIFTDLNTGQQITRKKVYDEDFLVRDSVRRIRWKLTSETREIAGYSCTRANAVVMDSVYVVAFFTEQIPVSGGPESFSGLPGMILGVALPHEGITWYAKSVIDQPVEGKSVAAPNRGKVTDRKGLNLTLKDALKDRGANAGPLLKAFIL